MCMTLCISIILGISKVPGLSLGLGGMAWGYESYHVAESSPTIETVLAWWCRRNFGVRTAQKYFSGLTDGCQASTPWGMGFQALLKLQHYTRAAWAELHKTKDRPKSGYRLSNMPIEDSPWKQHLSAILGSSKKPSRSQPFAQFLHSPYDLCWRYMDIIWIYDIQLYGHYIYMDIYIIWIYGD